jgi:DNA-directed RNA polymerase subunit F
MRNVIRFFSIIILAMVVNSLYAQPGMGNQGQRVQRTPEESAKTQVEWMKKDIKLTEANEKKVYDVILKYTKQFSAERQKLMAAGDREGMRAKMTEIYAERDKELKVILGEKDYKIFKEKEAARRQEMRSGR